MCAWSPSPKVKRAHLGCVGVSAVIKDLAMQSWNNVSALLYLNNGLPIFPVLLLLFWFLSIQNKSLLQLWKTSNASLAVNYRIISAAYRKQKDDSLILKCLHLYDNVTYFKKPMDGFFAS